MVSRRKLLLGAGVLIAGGLGGRAAAGAALSYPVGAPELRYRFASLEEALTQVRALCARGEVRTTGPWSWARILAHNAQGIAYSLDGYPRPKPAWVRQTVGRRVHAHFAQQGYMKHDLAAPIPGAPELPELDQAEALARLEAAIRRFQAHAGPLAPHFVYDSLDHPEYDRVHAMHLANHLAELA